MWNVWTDVIAVQVVRISMPAAKPTGFDSSMTWTLEIKKPLLALQRRMEVGMLVVFVGDGTEEPAGEIFCLIFCLKNLN
jgi:hypothetical protein